MYKDLPNAKTIVIYTECGHPNVHQRLAACFKCKNSLVRGSVKFILV